MRYRNYTNLARRFSAQSDHRYHRVVAIALNGGAIQGIAVNMGTEHAEARAVKMFPDANSLLVYRFAARSLATKEPRDSCPCGNCARLLQETDYKKITFLLDGDIVTMHPSALDTSVIRPWRSELEYQVLLDTNRNVGFQYAA